jgi:4'-phosphopantetheinyl transferase
MNDMSGCPSGLIRDPIVVEYCTAGTHKGIVPGIVSSPWLQQSFREFPPLAAAADTGGMTLWLADLADWNARLSDPAAAVVLGAAETQRAAAMSAAAVRADFVTSRILLRRVLGTLLGRPPADLELVIGAHGKPAVRWHGAEPVLHFNLSHSRGIWLLGVARGEAVGVDIETRDAVPNATRLASRVFSAAENLQLEAAAAVGETARDTAFLRGWTRKEAVLKAAGSGFTWVASAIEVGTDAVPRAVELPQQPASRALVWSVALPLAGHAAVALLSNTRSAPPAVATYRLVPSS